MSWRDVQAISNAFRALNPYDRRVVSSSVLEIEKDNFDPMTRKQRQIWCVAISAKRYALFVRDKRGARPEQFQLIAPHEPNPRRWLKTKWIDRYSGKRFSITTKGHHGDRRAARVQTYGDVIDAYELHPEFGEPSSRLSIRHRI